MCIVLCSYPGLFWQWETYPANQAPFKMHVRHLVFAGIVVKATEIVERMKFPEANLFCLRLLQHLS